MSATIKISILALGTALVSSGPLLAGAVEGADTVGLLLAYEQACNGETGWMPDEARTLLRLKAHRDGYRNSDNTHTSLAHARSEKYQALWALTGKREACLTVLTMLKETVNQPGVKELVREYAPPKQGLDCDPNGKRYSCYPQRGDN